MTAVLLTDPEAAQVYTEIQRLYRVLDTIPYNARPSSAGTRRASPEYLQIEAAIRTLTDRYRPWDEARPPDEKCRMAKAGLRPRTSTLGRRRL